MNGLFQLRVKSIRFLAILLALLVFLLLLAVDGLQFFPNQAVLHAPPLLTWGRFGFSTLVALLFLAVGALVWLYAHDRLVALLLFCFCLAMMVTFSVQTATASDVRNVLFLSVVAHAGTSFALGLLAALLLIFPRNYLEEQKPALRVYLAVLLGGSVLVTLYAALIYLVPGRFPAWLESARSGYSLLAIVGILITIIVSYRQSPSLRVRQQLRIFVGGLVLAFVPVLLLTLLPQVLQQPSIDAQLSAITLGLLPLALGYSILRYQILAFDTYIRHAVAWVVGIISLAVLLYLILAFGSVLLSSNISAYVVTVGITLSLLGPLTWWLARVAADRLFFSEIAYYRLLIEKPNVLSHEKLDIDGVAQLITTAAESAFETQEVCLFVLDEDTGNYQICPALRDDAPSDTARRGFLRHLMHAVGVSTHEGSEVDVHARSMQNADWLQVHEPIMHIIEHIAAASRPLLLSEASNSDAEMPTGLARYLVAPPVAGGFDPLLAPIRTQGKMIGVLVLGERSDRQQYAGPDFEAIDLIQSRFSSVLETARLYAQESRRVAILDALYSGVATVGETFQSVEEVAIAYTKVAAEAIDAGAQLWLYDETSKLLKHVIHLGSGPQLLSSGTPEPLQEGNWSPWFYQGGSPQSWQGPATQVPPCLPQRPSYPFAWLPLRGAQQQLGVLALTYPRPHLFSQQEKRILGMFADQLAAALANVTFTVRLRASYERQKELDRLKDQFIATASHELRTPLTAVLGYIELLRTYNEDLPVEKRAEFIAKAHRGCDELILMVGNIMDANRVRVDAENLNLSPVPLAQSVLHILEILEAMTRSQGRSIYMHIPADMCVMADDLRLRQVLLNLVSNAIKYSPEATSIDITCLINNKNVTVRIRDRGLGVPPQDQERLFGRFVRLERDLNSPTRGAGLGLYISKQLIEAMGGRIWVESSGRVGEGSTFAFTLQRATITQEEFQGVLAR